MSAAKISLIIPTYNRVGHVEQAIVSVLEQDYENFDLLVIDDGSEDETPQLLKRIESRDRSGRFKWLRQENAGQAAALNRAFAMVDGDLIGYLSSDDLLLPGAFEKLAQAAEADPEAEVFYPWYRISDLAGKPVEETRGPSHDFITALQQGACFPGVGALVRRSFYERVGGWDISYRYTPDLEWWLRSTDTKFRCVQEVLAVYTLHPGTLTFDSEKRRRYEERLRVLDELFERDDLPEGAFEVKDEAYASVFVITALEHLRNGDRISDARWMIEDCKGPLYSAEGNRLWNESNLALQWENRQLRVRAESTEARVVELNASVAFLEDARLHREGRIAELEAQVGRPVWLRVARKLVPPGLRPHAAAMWHRLKGANV